MTTLNDSVNFRDLVIASGPLIETLQQETYEFASIIAKNTQALLNILPLLVIDEHTNRTRAEIRTEEMLTSHLRHYAEVNDPKFNLLYNLAHFQLLRADINSEINSEINNAMNDETDEQIAESLVLHYSLLTPRMITHINLDERFGSTNQEIYVNSLEKIVNFVETHETELKDRVFFYIGGIQVEAPWTWENENRPPISVEPFQTISTNAPKRQRRNPVELFQAQRPLPPPPALRLPEPPGLNQSRNQDL